MPVMHFELRSQSPAEALSWTVKAGTAEHEMHRQKQLRGQQLRRTASTICM